MAGDRHYLTPPYGLGAPIVPSLAPIPLWSWGAVTPTGADGGWITPVPVLNIGGGIAVTQAGYFSIVPVLPLGGDGSAVVQTEGRKRRTYLTLMGRTRLGR